MILADVKTVVNTCNYKCFICVGGKIGETHKKASRRGNKRSKDDAASPEIEQPETASAIHDGIGIYTFLRQ